MKYPYRDPKWLREELEKHGSLSAVCRANNLNESTVVSYLGRHPEVKAAIKDLLARPPLLKGKKPQHKGQIRLAVLKRHQHDWTIEELRRANLPLYWNHDWLIAQLKRYKTVKAVAEQYSYQPSTLRRYIIRQPALSEKIKSIRKEMYGERVPVLLHLPPELAQRLNQEKNQREVVIKAIYSYSE